MNKIVILRWDDWSVLYVNGEDVWQGHEIDPEQLSKHCPIESIQVSWIPPGKLSRYVQENGMFPETLKECFSWKPK